MISALRRLLGMTLERKFSGGPAVEGLVRVITVRPALFGGWPLWEYGSQLDPSEVISTDRLMLGFLRWHGIWLAHHRFTGWDSVQNELTYWRHGSQFVEALQRELGHGFEIRNELEPLSARAVKHHRRHAG